MKTLGYFVVMAAAMMVLSRYLPGFHVDGWIPAVIAAVLLAALNTVLKPILFVLTFPFILLTLGLFLLVINAIVLWVTAMIVPGFRLDGFATTFIAALVLAAVSMAWKAIATDKS